MKNEQRIICPLCNDSVDKLLYRFHIESERAVIEKIKNDHPDWSLNDGICSRCIDYYHTEIVMLQRMLPEIGPYFPVKSPDDFIILPTPLRLDADPRYTGRGVTICFIDSGFYPHPDLVARKNRIKAIVSCVQNEKTGEEVSDRDNVDNAASDVAAQLWHGTMTSVVCAGDGYSSNGLYKSIAPDVELVLLKVQDRQGRITTASIVKALQWVLDNHAEYGIRIVNLSISDDEPASNKTSEVDQLAEKLIERGIIVVAAAGNDEQGTIKPPANALNVITVGGINDNNNLSDEDLALYHSTFGRTVDGLHKPELVAQAIWIAAPILPGTPEKQQAEMFHAMLAMSEEELTKNLYLIEEKINLNISTLPKNPVPFIHQLLKNKIQQTKFFSSDYMHVDGTSFAAPIVCSVIAQLLEAEATLTPQQIRHVLFSTANRIPQLPIERQGMGYIRPRKAILNILKKGVIMKVHDSPFINKRKKTIEFYIQNECAHHISLAGTFNHWAQDLLLMEPDKDGVWKITIPMLPQGKYYYKFFIDDRMWVEDVDNPYREPDGLNGWNSVLMVEN